MRTTLLLFLLIPSLLSAQELPYNNSGMAVYERILDYPGQSKDDLHKYSRKWVDDIFVQSSEVIQSENLVDGELMGKGYSESNLTHVIRISMIPNEYIGYKFSISSRDDKVRLRFYSVELADEYLNGIAIEAIDRSYRNKKSQKTIDAWVHRVGEINAVFDALIDSYKSSVFKSIDDEF